MTLRHGGELSRAMREYGHKREQWLDLSTGISPWSWPVPDLPDNVWRDLPDGTLGLEAVAARYFGCGDDSVLATPGSQFAISRLPGLLPKGRIALPARGYAEHEAAFVRAGHSPVHYSDLLHLESLVARGEVEHALVINPNNPTTELAARPRLEDLLALLGDPGRYLIVDEAFIDCTPEHSLAPLCPREGLVVMRSLGKFFGLAGLRLGFLLAPADLRDVMREKVDPWAVSHPAEWVGLRALNDMGWQAMQRERVMEASRRWLDDLGRVLPAPDWRSAGLFATGTADAAYCARLYHLLAGRALLARCFGDVAGLGALRLGLPAEEERERALDTIAAVAGEME